MSHFATFPDELARRCILAGSAARACETCGAPWERVLEERSEPDADQPRGKSGALDESGFHHGQNGRRGVASSFSNNPKLRPPSPLTTGWQPTCACPVNTGSAQSVVLDCFGGSGTVAAVATGHGRRAIYIDLNPAYLELARQRIGPMLCTDAPEAVA